MSRAPKEPSVAGRAAPGLPAGVKIRLKRISASPQGVFDFGSIVEADADNAKHLSEVAG